VPPRVGTTEETPSEPPITRNDGVSGDTQGARLSARRRAAVLVLLIGALAAIGAGVYLLVVQDGSSGSLAANPAALTDPTQTVASPAAVPKVTYALPKRLVIPKIGVDAAIENVGLTSGRDMASPSGPGKVGWFKFGPRPGNEGSAVLDGHSGYADGRPAAFDDLPKLKVGDKLYVEDARGTRIMFIVRKKKLYGRSASAAGVFGRASSRRLNLITCTGSFDVVAGTHAQRLVVFAEHQRPKGLSDGH